MTRALLYSSLFHIILVGVLLISALGEIEPETAPDTVRIRLRGRTGGIRGPGSAPSSPSGSLRDGVERPDLPGPILRGNDLERDFPTKAAQRLEPGELPALRTREPLSVSHAVLDSMPNNALDPLSGLESALPPETQQPTAPVSDKWAITWKNGRERGIIKTPSIDRDAFPAVTERLVDVIVMIEVSPQGKVISAVVEPPGSGDIRIDRYISGKTLDFVFEKTLDDRGEQIASFRLIFEGVDR